MEVDILSFDHDFKHEAIEFALDSKVQATISTANLKDITDVFTDMNAGEIQGRIVMKSQMPDLFCQNLTHPRQLPYSQW